MDLETKTFLIEKCDDLLHAPTCCASLKAVTQEWLNALDSDDEAGMSVRFVEELEADLVAIDDLINLAKSDLGKQIFGDEAPNVAKHGEAIKSQGALYCDCPACQAVEAILTKKEELLK